MEAMRHRNYKIQPLLKDVTEIKDRVDGLFSFVMTCYTEPVEQIDAAINSILLTEDVDIELIVCFDRLGSDEFKFISEKYQNMPNIQVYEHDNVGSSANKNFGMLKTKGEYIACVAGDMIVNVGAVDMFVTEFNKDDEIAVVYTGYEFIPEINRQLAPYGSFQTDKIRIQAQNAIDASMPQRYKYAIMFDDAFHSLGDWDWAMTHILHYEHVVKYHKHMLAYKHSIPPETGLSSHSHRNWTEIINCLCEKHSLKPYSERVCIFDNGVKHHGERLAKMTGWDINENIIHKPYNYKKCLILGCYRQNWELYFNAIHNNPDTEFSVLFVGSDIAVLNYRSLNEARYLQRYFKDHNIKVYTEDERCQADLAEFKIESKILRLPVEKPDETKICNKTRTDEFTVGVYIPLCPLKEHTKYSIPFYINLFKATPHIKYLVFGGQDNPDERLPNVEFVGWKPIEEVINKTDCYLRILPFDGVSITSVQYMMCDKPVITNHPIDGTINLDIDEHYMHDPVKAKYAMDCVMNDLTNLQKYGVAPSKIGFNADLYTYDKFYNTFMGTQGE